MQLRAPATARARIAPTRPAAAVQQARSYTNTMNGYIKAMARKRTTRYRVGRGKIDEIPQQPHVHTSLKFD